MRCLLVFMLLTSIEVSRIAAVTVLCNPESTIELPFPLTDEDLFCTNGGTCKANIRGSSTFVCDCPSNFTGPHCEFKLDEVPDCNLHCYNGGECQLGVRSPVDLSRLNSTQDYNYCKCPEGFYGEQCEISGIRCGTTHCLNGGDCLQIQHVDGTITDHCDCTTANKDGRKYAGRFCQSVMTTICPVANNNLTAGPENFCVNGGLCKTEPRVGCDCPEGFYGSLCEFQEHEAEAWVCNMNCGDHGFCRKGAKDTSFIDNFDFHDRRLTERYTEEFEHCDCEQGWVGLACNVRMDVCPGESVICLHGSECKLSTETGDFQCECNTARQGNFTYAGKYCQYRVDSYCTEDGKPASAFCTNFGTCNGTARADGLHPGCICPENFTGDHCEIMVGGQKGKGGVGNVLDPSYVILISILSGSLLGIILFILAAAIHRRRRLHRIFGGSSMNSVAFEINKYFGKRRKPKGKFQATLESIEEESLGNESIHGASKCLEEFETEHNSDVGSTHQDSIIHITDTKDLDSIVCLSHSSDEIGIFESSNSSCSFSDAGKSPLRESDTLDYLSCEIEDDRNFTFLSSNPNHNNRGDVPTFEKKSSSSLSEQSISKKNASFNPEKLKETVEKATWFRHVFQATIENYASIRGTDSKTEKNSDSVKKKLTEMVQKSRRLQEVNEAAKRTLIRIDSSVSSVASVNSKSSKSDKTSSFEHRNLANRVQKHQKLQNVVQDTMPDELPIVEDIYASSTPASVSNKGSFSDLRGGSLDSYLRGEVISTEFSSELAQTNTDYAMSGAPSTLGSQKAVDGAITQPPISGEREKPSTSMSKSSMSRDGKTYVYKSVSIEKTPVYTRKVVANRSAQNSILDCSPRTSSNYPWQDEQDIQLMPLSDVSTTLAETSLHCCPSSNGISIASSSNVAKSNNSFDEENTMAFVNERLSI